MKNSIFSIKTIVAIGIGSAIFVILGRFGSIPTGVPNTNFETTYAFLALMSALFGPIAGFLIGFIGHTLKDLLMWGSPWFSWIIASSVVGLIIGFTAKRIKLSEGIFGLKELIQFNIFQIGANGLAWFVVAPVLDIVIYDEPTNKVFTQGVVAGALNIATVAVLGSILAIAYAKARPKSKSLTKEL